MAKRRLRKRRINLRTGATHSWLIASSGKITLKP